VSDYWPGETKREDHENAMDKFLKNMGKSNLFCSSAQADLRPLDPFVKFAETAAFAIPAYGILASAAIGGLWGAIQPSTMHFYQVSCVRDIAFTPSLTMEP
jgi:hypothetical protein